MITGPQCYFLCVPEICKKAVGVCNKKIIPLVLVPSYSLHYTKFSHEGAKFSSKFVIMQLYSKRYWIVISPHSLRVLSTFDKIRDFSFRKFSSQTIKHHSACTVTAACSRAKYLRYICSRGTGTIVLEYLERREPITKVLVCIL